MNPKVSIIILNWNGWKDTIECLKSIYQINYPNYKIILVDNGSSDNSIEKIKGYCNKLKKDFYVTKYEEGEIKRNKKLDNSSRNLIILKASKNYGFAKGNNIGIKFALKNLSPNYILLLNNDTIVTENFLDELMKVTTNSKAGIFAPKLLSANNPKKIDSTGHTLSWGRIVDRGHGKVDKQQYDNKINVMGAKGAACLYKCEMLENIGLFNEKYITSYEDAELSWRATRNLWEAKYVPKSIVYHKSGKSIKKDDSKLLYFQGLTLKNITLTVKEYGNLNQKILFTFIIIKLMLISQMANWIGKIYSGRLNYFKAIKKLYE